MRCTEREFEQNIFATQQHRSVLEHMADSTFCLILPGNSQSSQRLTEAFLAGCIPVFIGPPWHSLPLTQKVIRGSCCPEWCYPDLPLKVMHGTSRPRLMTQNLRSHARRQELGGLPGSAGFLRA